MQANHKILERIHELEASGILKVHVIVWLKMERLCEQLQIYVAVQKHFSNMKGERILTVEIE